MVGFGSKSLHWEEEFGIALELISVVVVVVDVGVVVVVVVVYVIVDVYRDDIRLSPVARISSILVRTVLSEIQVSQSAQVVIGPLVFFTLGKAKRKEKTRRQLASLAHRPVQTHLSLRMANL